MLETAKMSMEDLEELYVNDLDLFDLGFDLTELPGGSADDLFFG